MKKNPSSIPSSAAAETEFQSSWRLLDKFADTDVFQTLIDNEFKDPADIEKKEIRAIGKVLQYSGKKIPYYKAQFENKKLTASSFASLQEINQYPILTRYDLLNQFELLKPPDLDQNSSKVLLTRTTGSTGLPVSVLLSQESRSMFPILWQRLARWFRLDLDKRFARIRIPPDLFKLEEGKNNPDGNTVGRNSWMHSGLFFETGDEIHFNVSNSRKSQLDWLEKFNPAYLLTFPGLMEELALANNCKPVPSLESLISISSILTTSMRSRIEQSFEVPIEQPYGLNEIGLVATKCSAHRYHVNCEHAFVEIVDSQGQSVNPGDSGRLLVTSLNNSAMPLIRYDTGDLATLSSGNCPCGRTQPSFENILGRYIRFAGTPEGTRPRLNGLLKVLAKMPNELFKNIRRYQIHQMDNKDFEIKVVADGPISEGFKKQLEEVWRTLNSDGEVWGFTLTTVDEIASTPSGKQLDFVSAFHELDSDFATPGN